MQKPTWQFTGYPSYLERAAVGFANPETIGRARSQNKPLSDFVTALANSTSCETAAACEGSIRAAMKCRDALALALAACDQMLIEAIEGLGIADRFEPLKYPAELGAHLHPVLELAVDADGGTPPDLEHGYRRHKSKRGGER